MAESGTRIEGARPPVEAVTADPGTVFYYSEVHIGSDDRLDPGRERSLICNIVEGTLGHSIEEVAVTIGSIARRNCPQADCGIRVDHNTEEGIGSDPCHIAGGPDEPDYAYREDTVSFNCPKFQACQDRLFEAAKETEDILARALYLGAEVDVKEDAEIVRRNIRVQGEEEAKDVERKAAFEAQRIIDVAVIKADNVFSPREYELALATLMSRLEGELATVEAE